jgi:hypothetical protein
MKTEQVKAKTEIKSNIEVGSILVQESNTTIKYRVVYISIDNNAVLVSQHHADTTALIDLSGVRGWLKVLDEKYY